MKKLLKALGILTAAAMLLAAAPERTQADSPQGSITLTECDLTTKQPVPGVALAVYQVANVSGTDVSYTSDFEGLAGTLPISSLTDGDSQTDNTERLDTYVEGHTDITPFATGTTDGNGVLTFSGLPDGIYFFRQTGQSEEMTKEGKTVTAEPFFISIPLVAGGVETRTITDAKPKCTVSTVPGNTDINVYKIWKDDSDREGKRPDSITVGLYDGDACVDKEVLSAGNNWMHSWKSLPTDGHSYSVKELSVPTGYTSSVSGIGYDFTITNTYKHETPTPTGKQPTPSSGKPTPTTRLTPTGGRTTPVPHKGTTPVKSVKTGDTSHALLWGILMIGAAAAIAGVIIFRRKKQ
ncbi:MAG: Cna B-type domain-containing protein [Chordicoccus sp.]